MWGIGVVVAKSQTDLLSETVKKSLKHKVEVYGEWYGYAPLGYLNKRDDRGRGLVIPDPINAPIIKKIFEEYATGAYTLGEISQKAKNWRLRTKSRTGKYDPETKKELSVHKKDSSLDKVSESFLEGAKSEKIEPIFNNFVFGEKSVFNGYLGAALINKHSLIVIGGESSSQITQATNLLPGQVYIKANSAMSDIHKLHVTEVLKAGTKELQEETSLSMKGLNEKKILIDEFNEISNKFVNEMTDEQMKELLTRQADLQEKTEACDAWNLERESYDNISNIPPNDADIVATEFLKYYPEVELIRNE